MYRFLILSLFSLLSFVSQAQPQAYQTSTDKIRTVPDRQFMSQAEKDLIKAAKTSAVLLGTWNPATNTPALTASAATVPAGGYYVVNVAGAATFGGTNFSPSTTFEVGDQLAKVGNQWTRLLASLNDGIVTQAKLTNGAVTREKIRNGAISADKTTFLTPGKNLFNLADPEVVLNQYIEPDGSFHALNGFNTSGYIPVLAGVTYTPSEKQHLVYYDAAQVRLSGEAASRASATFTTPAGCAYVRGTISSLSAFQLEVGSSATAYQPYQLQMPSLQTRPYLDQAAAETSRMASAVRTGKNLFNPADPGVLLDQYIDENGGLHALSGFKTSGYIPVLGGVTYAANKKDQIAFFDKERNWIAGVGSGRPANSFTTPANCAYVRCTVVFLDQFQLEAGSTATGYEAYRVTVAGLVETTAPTVRETYYGLSQIRPAVSVSKNLFNPADPGVVLNQYIEPDGSFHALNGFNTSGYIPVLAGVTYTPSEKQHLVYYDAAQVRLSGEAASRSTASFTTPAGCAYVRGTISSLSAFQLEVGSSATAYQAYFTPAPRLPTNFAQKAFVSAQNETNLLFTPLAKQALSAIDGLEISVPTSLSAHTWAISLLTRTTTTLPHVFDHKVQLIDENTGTQYDLVATHVPTAGVEKIPFSTSGITGSILINWSALPAQFELWDNGRIYVNVNVKSGLVALSYGDSPWQGKTIWWTGTSIPHAGLYPEQASAQVGATCINKAQGSSMARRAKADGSWTGLAWQNVAYALTQTSAEKDSLITNWSTIRTGLANTPPETLSDAEKTLIRSCSYEVRLMPYLNGTLPMPDLFVLDHGHNDNLVSDTDAQFTQVPANRTNKNTFLGAMNFLIDKILTANPRARIVVFGHYENQKPEKIRISVAQQTLASYWQFPISKTWEKTGWSQQKVPGSKSLWSQAPYSNYSAGQDTNQDMTVLRVWNPDDLHPSSDPTGRAQGLLTRIAAWFLRGL
jgi:hypothetical protein